MSSVVIAEFPVTMVTVQWNKDAPYSVFVCDAQNVIEHYHSNDRASAIRKGMRLDARIHAELQTALTKGA